jgi:hypothetical protein
MSTATTEHKLEATFSMLVMSIASNAVMAMGLTPNPETGKTETDRQLARFNIDLLVMLKEKTKNNLSSDESGLIEHIVQDLQMKFVQLK